jgi:hypothetical protein
MHQHQRKQPRTKGEETAAARRFTREWKLFHDFPSSSQIVVTSSRKWRKNIFQREMLMRVLVDLFYFANRRDLGSSLH